MNPRPSAIALWPDVKPTQPLIFDLKEVIKSNISFLDEHQIAEFLSQYVPTFPLEVCTGPYPDRAGPVDER